MKQSPATIRAILDIHTLPRGGDHVPLSIIAEFKAENLIKPDAVDDGQYQLTERGRAWVEMLCATPLPKSAWPDPRSKTIVYT